jgi:hypothetical protein
LLSFQPKTEEQQQAISKRLLKRDNNKRKRIADLGIDYEFEGYKKKPKSAEGEGEKKQEKEKEEKDNGKEAVESGKGKGASGAEKEKKDKKTKKKVTAKVMAPTVRSLLAVLMTNKAFASGLPVVSLALSGVLQSNRSIHFFSLCTLMRYIPHTTATEDRENHRKPERRGSPGRTLAGEKVDSHAGKARRRIQG